jgi:hypothetical protein
MNKIKLYKILIVFLIVANLIMVWQLMSFKSRPHRAEVPRNEIIKALGFDKAQIMLYDILIKKHREDIRGNEQKLNNLKSSYFLQLNTEVPSLQKDSVLQLIGDLAIEKEQINYRHFEDIRNICKPNQLKEFKNIVNQLNNLFVAPPPPHR